jgi:preprotein translocase SecE subunit
MARQTRQQRRARRTQQPALAGGPPPRGPERPVANGGAEPSRRPPREERQAQGGGGGPINFIRESWGELKKVEWPDRQAVISGTAVVIIACAIVGSYLWLNDQVWKYVVEHVLLR